MLRHASRTVAQRLTACVPVSPSGPLVGSPLARSALPHRGSATLWGCGGEQYRYASSSAPTAAPLGKTPRAASGRTKRAAKKRLAVETPLAAPDVPRPTGISPEPTPEVSAELLGETIAPARSGEVVTGSATTTRRRQPRKKRATPEQQGDVMVSAADNTPDMGTAIVQPAEGGSSGLLDEEESLFGSMGVLDTGTRAASRGSLHESTLVYNPLNGRMASENSFTIACLRQIGFGINEHRQVCLENPEEFNSLAERIRSGTAVLPNRWPVTLTRVLSSVLTNTSVTDPAAAIVQMMQIKVHSIMRSRYASVVSANNTDPSKSEVSDPLHFLDEATDPTKSIVLNEEQERVIEMALRGHHLYIGGSAGTGKTVLLRVLSRRLQAHRLRVAMTATTGVAGCHIGGCTFHHAIGVSSRGDFIRRSSILDYDAIIIDEVSMFPLRLFEDFDRVLREEAGTPDLPFGGVQIILCGDFLQLGCINEDSIIGSHLFQQNFVKLRLETQVRQSAHTKFAMDLQKMRLGEVPADLTETVQQLPAGTMVESAVNLLPTNKEVHAANDKEMERLEGDPLTLVPETGITALAYETTVTLLLKTSSGFNEGEFSRHVRSLLQATLDLPRSSLLSLYRVYEDGHAMRVILPPGESVAWREAMKERFLEVAGLINDLNLCATVTEIVPNGDGLYTPECEEYLQKLMSKHPIAQSLTLKLGARVLLRANLSSNLVNGSIGTVVDFVECRPENFPEYLRNENVDSCIDRYRVFCFTECGMPIPLVPVVKFHSGETVAVPPWEFVVGGGATTQYYSLSSVALPLSLAYAFTVHKVQGLTLVGRVHLELSRMWPCEHLLYVAMSRVRNPEQLSMSSFSPSMIVANAVCVEFDNQLSPAHHVTLEVLAKFPVSSWKRCNDTIYHMRRKGASLRRLLEDVTMNRSGTARYDDPSASSTSSVVGSYEDGHVAGGSQFTTAATMNAVMMDISPRGGPARAAVDHGLDHLTGIEQSVLVARRMRKLVRHVERVAKLNETRRKIKNRVAVESAPPAKTSGGNGPLAVVAAAEVELNLSEEHSF